MSKRGDDRSPWSRSLDALRIPRRVHPQAPLARALFDHARTGRPGRVRALRPSGLHYEIETSDFFELAGAQSSIDEAIVARARGRVLDVGAGAGRHALALEAQGHPVRAIDVSPICVELMRARGVRDARRIDIWDLVSKAKGGDAGRDAGRVRDSHSAAADDERFDTVLFAMQSIGIVGTLAGLDEMLSGLHSLLAPGGRVLLDSSAPAGADFEALFTFETFETASDEPGRGEEAMVEVGASVDQVSADRLAGEAEVAFSYRNWRGSFFPWLYLGASVLAHAAARRGFACEVIARADDSSEYLAILEPKPKGDAVAGVYDSRGPPSPETNEPAGPDREQSR